jgi:hypothetical protein
MDGPTTCTEKPFTRQAPQESHNAADSAAAQYPTAADPAPGQQDNRTNKSTADAHADAPAQTQRHTGYTSEPTPSSDSAVPSLIRNSCSSSDVVILSPRINPLKFPAEQHQLPA